MMKIFTRFPIYQGGIYMRWFDSDFDYVQEMIDSWNKRKRKVRISCFILAALLIIAGILTVVFPIRIFALIQYVAAAAMIIMGIYHLVSYGSMTYYFRDSMLLVTGLLNILVGIMLLFMPVALTVEVITFMLAFLLLFSGAQKLSFGSRLRYFRMQHTGFLTVGGVLDIILAVIFLLLPFTTALAMNYIIAAYLLLGGIVVFIEAISMRR